MSLKVSLDAIPRSYLRSSCQIMERFFSSDRPWLNHVNKADHLGRNMIHNSILYQARTGIPQLEIICLNIAQGADPNAEDLSQLRPLDMACLLGLPKVIQTLKQHGANHSTTFQKILKQHQLPKVNS